MKLKLFHIIAIILIIVVAFVLLVIPEKINGEVSQMSEQKEIKLPTQSLKGEKSLEEILNQRRSIRSYKREPLTIEELSQLLWSAQGITEKSWGLRTAPSAGALYPLEIYVVIGNVRDLEVGVYKYIPETHSIIKILDGDRRREIYNSALQQESIIQAPVNFVIAAVFQRTAVKYGDRAERYVHIEVGHSAQNLLLQATALNLGAVPIGAFYDDKIKKALNLNKDEEPLYIIPVGKKLFH